MKKTIFFSTLFMSFSLLFLSFVNKDSNDEIAAKTVKTTNSVPAPSLADTLMDSLHLDSLGLTQEAVEYAVKGFGKLDSLGKVNNPYLTIVDLSQSSRKKRFYIIDMRTHQLVWNTFVSHGKNSGVDMAEKFSNQMNSEESSLGFYVTETTYTGKHGLSLRINGLEEGFNSNAEARGVVVHGAPYVNADRVNSGYMGRSQGCPALPENEYAKVINIIKDGSVLFVYHPSAEYLQSSSILNS
jgi:hypothetical protein